MDINHFKEFLHISCDETSLFHENEILFFEAVE